MSNLNNTPTYEEITERTTPSLTLSQGVKEFYAGNTVLVTGAGGSIGSRIVKQLSRIEGVRLVATDRDENSLHSLSLETSSKALFDNNSFKILDIRDSLGIELLLQEFTPSIVIHAAALKHLSALETQPREALLTNCLGTYNLIKSSDDFGVTKFLNISTDKAANPTSILGVSKLYTEKVVNHFRREGRSNYTSVRFGNVFASKGSVIQTFSHQIQMQTPITLTDYGMKRFFMNIDEAAFLAITALQMNAGQTHLLDMGDSIPIVKIIGNLQKYYGSSLPIEVTGIRAGEKLDEDLSAFYETARTSEHAKIRVLESESESPKIIEPADYLSNESARKFFSDCG